MNAIDQSVNALLLNWGYALTADAGWEQRSIIILIIAVVAIGLHALCRKVIVPLVQRLVERTSVTWDDHLFNTKVQEAGCIIIPLLFIYLTLPIAFIGKPFALLLTNKLCLVAIIAISIKLACAFVASFYTISNESEKLRKRPLKGLYQMLNIIIIGIGTILIISVLIDKSPGVLLTGIGASAAILMLVFKDSIMGLVAGVQLSAYDMLRPGDWIKMDKHGANGIVTEVTLNVVKVRNWDNTIITIPSYSLVSESFQNWRGMRESAGRRITERIYIDIETIHFCQAEEVAHFSKLSGWNPEKDGCALPTNLHFFREHLEAFMLANPEITPLPHLMVRQQPATDKGLPLEIYCFTTNKDWIPYEHFKASLIEYAIASLPLYGLRAFQSPSGKNISDTVR